MNLDQELDMPRPSHTLVVLAALALAIASAGFEAAAGDIPNFATGGVTVLLGQKTN